MQEILTVTNLTKTFALSRKQQKIDHCSTKIAVNGLSFSLRKGEIFGLLGTNGAGKTTTLRMIATLIKPNTGSISLDGIDAIRQPEKIRERIGFLTSELKLEDYFTPDYMFHHFARLYGIDSKTTAQRKAELFSRLGIDQFAHVKIGELSTGMKQKVSIAVSLVHDPEVIIFDEPTNGLDIITAKTVTDFLLSLKASGKTLLLSSHIFSLIEKTCDRVGIMVNGRMVYTDDLANIRRSSSLEDTFFEIHAAEEGEKNHA